jgi:hypothetical protein
MLPSTSGKFRPPILTAEDREHERARKTDLFRLLCLPLGAHNSGAALVLDDEDVITGLDEQLIPFCRSVYIVNNSRLVWFRLG